MKRHAVRATIDAVNVTSDFSKPNRSRRKAIRKRIRRGRARISAAGTDDYVPAIVRIESSLAERRGTGKDPSGERQSLSLVRYGTDRVLRYRLRWRLLYTYVSDAVVITPSGVRSTTGISNRLRFPRDDDDAQAVFVFFRLADWQFSSSSNTAGLGRDRSNIINDNNDTRRFPATAGIPPSSSTPFVGVVGTD